MSKLTAEELKEIGKILENKLEPIKADLTQLKADVSQIKADVSLIAKLNQIDDIRKEPRLRKLYNDDQVEA